MSDDHEKTTPPATASSEDLVEKIHEIQEEIFDREDQIDEIMDSVDDPDPMLDAVEDSRVYRRNLHLLRLRRDWERMVLRSREANSDNDFELAAALVHFIGDILTSQTEGTGNRWIKELREYLVDHREPVN